MGVREATRALHDGITDRDGLEILGSPDASVFAFRSSTHDVSAVCDVMDDLGWHLDRQPDSLHLIVTPNHARIVEPFLADLRRAVETHGDSRGKEARYA